MRRRNYLEVKVLTEPTGPVNVTVLSDSELQEVYNQNAEEFTIMAAFANIGVIAAKSDILALKERLVEVMDEVEKRGLYNA